MSVPAIHVHTQADKSTVLYAKFMWETMLSLANRPELLKLTVHCIGPTAATRADGWMKQGKTVVVLDKKGDQVAGSRGHGVCVNDALKSTGDGDIHIIADSDTVIVAKGWDDYVRKRLLDEGIGIMGSTYEELGGFSSGTSTVQTYKKVPSLTWCALSPNHDWRTLDVTPNKSHQVAITSEKLSKIYNLPQGYNVFGEVGWQLPQYVCDNSLKYDGWRQLKPSKDSVVLAGLSDYHEEYHADGVPFMTHHRGSMRHAYRGDKISARFYSAVDAYLANETTRAPRWTWTEDGKQNVPVYVTKAEDVVVEKPVVIEPDKYTPCGKEWIKATFNGGVIRTRRGINRTQPALKFEFQRPDVDKVGHLRIEGRVEHNYPIVVPEFKTEPYMITLRNTTGATLFITSGNGTPVAVPTSRTWWLLVDADGVQRVE